jgi:hypothetical protein
VNFLRLLYKTAIFLPLFVVFLGLEHAIYNIQNPRTQIYGAAFPAALIVWLIFDVPSYFRKK